MPILNQVFLLIGSNIHPRRSFIADAVDMIASKVGRVIKLSRLYESEPWGFESPTNFINQVVLVETPLEVKEVHSSTQWIEIDLGRRKKKGNGYQSRTIDIDLLYFNEIVMDTENLILPHPRLQERRFTLLPLVELAPAKWHPVLKCSQVELLANCQDKGQVWPII